MKRLGVWRCVAVMMALSLASPAVACMAIPGPYLTDLWPGEKADTSTTTAIPWRSTFSLTVAGAAIAIVWWRRSIEKRQVDMVSAASEVDDDLS